MRTNATARSDLKTYEGAPAKMINPELQLRRSVMSCLLFEDEFYESGQEIGARLIDLVGKVDPEKVSAIAIEARTQGNLRHAPLLLARALAKVAKGEVVAKTVDGVIQRADEMGELLAIYWKDKRQPVSAAVKRGLRRAFGRFNEYALGKYDRDAKVKLRDVLRIVRPKPKDAEQAALWKRVLDRTLATPDTWEVALSGGADKKATFERLIRERQLGYLALLRNLRKMLEVGVDLELIQEAIVARRGGAERVLPFRYVAAAKAAPSLEPALDKALIMAIDDLPQFPGRTIVLVDVSGSMDQALSGKSDMTRVVAAATLASIMPGNVRVFTFSHNLVEVPPRRGMSGVDAVLASQPHGGTYLGAAVTGVNKLPHDRLIVISDEESHDPVPDPVAKHAYMINVASAKNGVGYGKWTHIDGFSENVFRFISAVEADARG